MIGWTGREEFIWGNLRGGNKRRKGSRISSANIVRKGIRILKEFVFLVLKACGNFLDIENAIRKN